mgnify:CR=1 FL=1
MSDDQCPTPQSAKATALESLSWCTAVLNALVSAFVAMALTMPLVALTQPERALLNSGDKTSLMSCETASPLWLSASIAACVLAWKSPSLLNADTYALTDSMASPAVSTKVLHAADATADFELEIEAETEIATDVR